MNADVIIVGAGPAGAAAASTLAPSGCRVMVIERAFLPRYKPCGGAMPTVVWRHWSEPARGTWHHQVAGCRIWGPLRDAPPECVPVDMTFVDRAEFDAALLASAQVAGRGRVSVLTGARVTAVTEKAKQVQVGLDDGRRLTASYLVAADGASGGTAGRLGVSPVSMAVAIAAQADAPQTSRTAIESMPLFDMSAIDGGYGWIFPGRIALNCGMATWTAPRGIRGKLDHFLRRRLPSDEIRISRWRVAPMPVFTPGRPLGTPRVCLVGDAAGLVDPISGEGIQYALISGRLAAETVLAADGGPCLDYSRRVMETIGQRLARLIGFVQPLFLGAPDRFFDHLTRVGDYASWFSGASSP